VGIDIDLNDGEMRHPISTSVILISEENMSDCHSDIGRVPILTSESIPISEKYLSFQQDLNPKPLF
jgi:hypothetical protein